MKMSFIYIYKLCIIYKKLYNALFAGDDILFFDEDSGHVTFSSDEMGILSVDLNNIKPGDTNFYEDDPKTIIHVRLLASYDRLKQRKPLFLKKQIINVSCMASSEVKTSNIPRFIQCLTHWTSC